MSRSSSSFGIDTTVPSTARMYDYWLGGHDYFAADRAAALKVSEAAPMAVENRGYLCRAVRYLAPDAGIIQFLDIGIGLPTQGNVNQVARDINPAAGVVYVDNDPMVLAHSRALKTGGNIVVIEADLRDLQSILDHPGTRLASGRCWVNTRRPAKAHIPARTRSYTARNRTRIRLIQFSPCQCRSKYPKDGLSLRVPATLGPWRYCRRCASCFPTVGWPAGRWWQ